MYSVRLIIATVGIYNITKVVIYDENVNLDYR